MEIGDRIIVMGTTDSGKSTLAGQIASIKSIPHIELDALHWQENWTPMPLSALQETLKAQLEAPSWVVDGNYSIVRDIIWPHADTLIWLDYRLTLILWRLLKRTLRRLLGRKILWNGNTESLWRHFFTKDSLFLWVFQTHFRRRRELPALVSDYPHLVVHHVTRPGNTETLLNHLRDSAISQPGPADDNSPW